MFRSLLPTLNRLCLTSAILLVPVSAMAHPHETEKKDSDIEISIEDETLNGEDLMEKLDEKLSKHSVEIAKSMSKVKRDLEKHKGDGDFSQDMESVADALEEVFKEDGLFRDLTAMLGDFAEDVDLVSDEDATVLKFDGATIGSITRSKKRDSEDSLSISGLGQNLTLNRETIVENGKSKTRIVIEMDGNKDIDVTLPGLDKE